jgi:hypothetical protein
VPQLNHRLYPIKGESLQSFIARLAYANNYSYQRFSEFYNDRAAALRSYGIGDRARIRSLTQELCGEIEIQNLIDIWSYYENDRELFDFSRIKLCPCCYKTASSSISAKYWLKHIISCNNHQRLLIDRCSTCNTNITFHTLAVRQCLKCNTLISDMKAPEAEGDGFSKVLNEAFASVETPELFLKELKNISYQVLNQLKIVLLLVDIPSLSADKYWKKRRKLTIEDLLLYQTEGYKYIEDVALLKDKIKGFVFSEYKSGKRDLSYILSSFTRLDGAKGTQFFFDLLKEVIGELAEECPEISLSISWLEKFYQIEETRLDSFIYLNHFDLYSSGSKKTINIESLSIVLNNYKRKLIE